MSFATELGLLNRPYLPVTLKIGGQSIEVRARALSAREADALDAFRMDEYGSALLKLTEPTDKGISELERVKRMYMTRTVRDVVEQLIPTREADALIRAREISGLNLREVNQHLNSLEGEEKEAYAKEMNETMDEALAQAREQIREELSLQSLEDLAKTVAEVNVNIRAQGMSNKAANVAFLAAALYSNDTDEHYFKNADEVEDNLTQEQIGVIADQVRKVFVTDLPLESPAADEPSKQPSSPSTSEEVTPDSDAYEDDERRLDTVYNACLRDMITEGLQMVPRKDRPLPQDLEGYERKSEPEPDYTLQFLELGAWLADHRREEEEKRENQAEGRTPLAGHETSNYLINGARRGFSEEDFDLEAVTGVVKSRPRH